MEDHAITAPGNFSRLAPLMGTFHAFLNASEKGDLPPPAFISTSSASGIAASIAVQRSEEKQVRAEEMIINLKKKQFASLNPEIRNKGTLTVAATLAMLLTTQRIKEPYLRTVVTAGICGFAFWAQKEFIKDLFHVESFFRYDRLVKLLLTRKDILDFDLVFNSPTKIEIPAVNLNKTGWRLNEILADPPLYLGTRKSEGWVSVTNFRPEDTNLANKEERNRRFAEGIVNGTRLPYFNPGRTDEGDYVVDTAFLSNLPIHFAINEGYSNIVIPYYNSSVEAPTDVAFTNWLQTLNRSLDISVSAKTKKAILGYLRVNNDLHYLNSQLEELKRLEEVANSEHLDNFSAGILASYIRNTRTMLRSLSYSHKKKINFVFIRSTPLPHVHFSEFTKDQMVEGINIGYTAGLDVVPEIAKMIKLKS